MELWLEIISQVGFPITTALACSYFIFKIWNKEQDQMERRDRDTLDIITRLSSILSENSKALLKNSEVMEKISEKVDAIDSKLEGVKEDVQEIKIKQEQQNNNKRE